MLALPTHAELDAAQLRGHRRYEAHFKIRLPAPQGFKAWCDSFLATGQTLGPVIGPDIIGAADAQLLADAFDRAMREAGSPLRAVRPEAVEIVRPGDDTTAAPRGIFGGAA